MLALAKLKAQARCLAFQHFFRKTTTLINFFSNFAPTNVFIFQPCAHEISSSPLQTRVSANRRALPSRSSPSGVTESWSAWATAHWSWSPSSAGASRGGRKLTDLRVVTFAENCMQPGKHSCGSCSFGARAINALLDHCTNLEELSIERIRGIHDGFWS